MSDSNETTNIPDTSPLSETNQQPTEQPTAQSPAQSPEQSPAQSPAQPPAQSPEIPTSTTSSSTTSIEKEMVPIEQPDYVCCNVPGEIESVETVPQDAEDPVNVDVTLDVAPTINLTFGKPKICLVNYGATKSYFPKKKPCN